MVVFDVEDPKHRRLATVGFIVSVLDIVLQAVCLSRHLKGAWVQVTAIILFAVALPVQATIVYKQSGTSSRLCLPGYETSLGKRLTWKISMPVSVLARARDIRDTIMVKLKF